MGTVGLDELATQIVHWEQEDITEVGHVNHEDHHERVVASLYHAHLPKLADAGVLDYDADRGTVQSRSNARLEIVLSTAEDLDLSDTEVSLDAVFDVLANARRRTALRTLMTHGDLPLPDLADEVAVTEHDRPLTEIDDDAVLQVYLSLVTPTSRSSLMRGSGPTIRTPMSVVRVHLSESLMAAVQAPGLRMAGGDGQCRAGRVRSRRERLS